MSKRSDKWKAQAPQADVQRVGKVETATSVLPDKEPSTKTASQIINSGNAMQTAAVSVGVATPQVEPVISKAGTLWQYELGIASKLAETIAVLQNIRDSRCYQDADNHTFREWCINQFGEGIGIWLDEHL